LYELFDYEKIQRKIESGVIEIAPLAFMRGRTLKNSFAILDEAQNATATQIKMFLTRIGENSSLVVNGDPSQIDLPNKSQSGLLEAQNILKDIKEIGIVNFDHKDVIRHPLVTKIVEAYQKRNNDKG
jgi:phosphate starvation-inducible PhoH-like protein